MGWYLLLLIFFKFFWFSFRNKFPLSGGSDRHAFHHSHNVGNFGMLSFWDTVMGTDKKYREWKAEQQQGTNKTKKAWVGGEGRRRRIKKNFFILVENGSPMIVLFRNPSSRSKPLSICLSVFEGTIVVDPITRGVIGACCGEVEIQIQKEKIEPPHLFD